MPNSSQSDLIGVPVPYNDPSTDSTSTWALVASNALALAMALLFKWSITDLLWPYWLQSLVIGYYSCRRMLALRDFSTAGISTGDSDTPVPETETGKWQMVRFFILHYGFFHAGYFVFLFSMSGTRTALDWLGIAVATLGFIWSHHFSWKRNCEADLERRQSLVRMMLLPYLRIVPMHLTVMLGIGAMHGNAPFGLAATLALFFVLKTTADVAMHRLEHRLLRRGVVEANNQP